MDEEADLALLDQHLLKTNLLSQRMTNILGQLDTRLSRLDKTIAPLGLQPLTRKAANIEAIILSLSGKDTSHLRSGSGPTSTSSAQGHPSSNGGGSRARPPPSINSSSSSIPQVSVKGYSVDPPVYPQSGTHAHFNSHLTPIASAAPSGTTTPADEVALLTRGPDIMSLSEYLTALDGVVGDLERMWKGLVEGRGGAREAGVKDLSKLVEIGFSGLVQLFLKLSKDGTGRIADTESLIANGPPTPPNLFPPLNTLLPLTTKIQSMMYPANPLPKTASIIQPIYDEGIANFADLRGEWMRRSLGSMARRVDEIDEGGIWEESRGREKVKGLVGLWETTLVLAEAETMLITTLFPNDPPPTLLAQSLSQPLNLLSSTLTSTTNTIKRSLSLHSFVAIELYSSLYRLQGQWENVLSRCLASVSPSSSSASKDLQAALNSPVSTLRGLSLRSFPELLVDIRTAKSDSTPTSSIAETTHSTLTYLEILPAYEGIVETLLGSSHSERSWLMGMKEPPSSVRSAGEEGGVVNLFVADVLGTLLIHLEGRSRAMRKPIGQAFLLNNLSHIRNTTSSFNSDIIGPGAEDMLNKAFRDAKSQYLAEFTSLSSLLSVSTQTPRFGVTIAGSAERQSMKDSAQAFFERLSELEALCLQYPLSRSDPEMRDRVGKEAEGIVRGAYEGFVGRAAGKGVEKYLRGTPDDVARRTQSIFR